MTLSKTLIRSLAGIVLSAILFFSSGLKVPGLDPGADDYFRDAMVKAGAAYATCRAINASVSIIKESKLQLEPAGVGISVAAGQALDPIDDMTERLSDVLVVAIVSLGVQKLAHEIGVSLAPPILAVLALLLSALIWIKNEKAAFFQKALVRFLFLILIVRFFLPLSSLANGFLQTRFFDPQASQARQELALVSSEADLLKDLSLSPSPGILGAIKNSAALFKQQTARFKRSLSAISKNMGLVIENLLKLTFLYVGFFLIQVIILPLLAFWLLSRGARVLFDGGIR
ncbi:conserved membrane hypothetical protein [Candidatus Desulfarcum epimagneticum]|uniref:Uncharacterized protein n=1 Tax=uncultured Desulfobacteraceae bacterium TaxID=218296 RepID=A0A484HG81_9BACT|nr:conserved membrane hypothetical protein [uncultured Desulfobacteraceae bacterium]